MVLKMQCYFWDVDCIADYAGVLHLAGVMSERLGVTAMQAGLRVVREGEHIFNQIHKRRL